MSALSANSTLLPPAQSPLPLEIEPDASQGGCDGLCAMANVAADQAPVSAGAQRRWAARPLVERLQVVRAARHSMAAHCELLAESVSPELPRSRADTLVTEVLPLLEAMRFLERKAQTLLAARKLGRPGRPLWLAGVQAEVQRVPLGHVLVVGPANFPLFLPGTQVLQALVAGNAVTWKPGRGGRRVALLIAQTLRGAGLPRGVLQVTGEEIDDAHRALTQEPAPDKVVFTGSAAAGRSILHDLATTNTPAVMELSGADAVVVLPSADLALVAQAIAFGLRLNGGQVCMSPRRIIATADVLQRLEPLLHAALDSVPAVTVRPEVFQTVHDLTGEAVAQGATLVGTLNAAAQKPLLLRAVRPEMRVAQSDLFAPVISLVAAPSVLELASVVNACQFGLTAAIFGDPNAACTLGAELKVGTVLVNDLIAPTADPRVPFGGRGASGFGVTRGAEGLLEMTAARTLLVRRRIAARHYAPVGTRELPFFVSLIGALHGGSLADRWRALRKGFTAARQAGSART